jgi:type VI secretion system protein ImpE
MTSIEHFQSGRLGDAIQSQTLEVKAHPADVERRYLLFAFLSFAGELERADRQLDALGAQDAQLEIGSRVYRNLLASEMSRKRVFESGEEPLIPPNSPPHVALRREALAALQRQDRELAERKLGEAADLSPALAGIAGERAFTSVRDSDDLLASVLEVFAGGRYLWLPFENVRGLTLSKPRHVLDLLWASAEIEDAGGERAAVHIPALYYGSSASSKDAIRLGRATEWNDDGGTARGQGQRILLASFSDSKGEDFEEEIPILGLRSLKIGEDAGSREDEA